MKLSEVKATEYNNFYAGYIDPLPKDLELLEGFKKGKKSIIKFLKSIPDNKLNFKYQSRKWSVKEVIQHIIDTERIMMYRCFRIAREDKTPLSGFDENTYIIPSAANKKTITKLIDEYESNRNNSIVLINSLSDMNLRFIGESSNYPLSARAVAFITLGHEVWHKKIIKERYL